MINALKEHIRNIITENPRSPDGVSYGFTDPSGSLRLLLYVDAITQGNPSPRKTLTEFEPVTLPTAESAYFEFYAAAILANVSGREVPRATNVIAVTESRIPITHPSIDATSPTTAVTDPINANAVINAGHPLPQ